MTNQVQVRCYDKLTLDGKDLPGVATGDWALFAPHEMATSEGERVCKVFDDAWLDAVALGIGFFEEPCEILAERDLGR